MIQGPIIDTPFNAGSRAASLRAAGIETVIRYYNFQNSHTFPEKRLTAPEAGALCAAGLNLGVVFQQRHNAPDEFSREKGLQAGRKAHQIGEDEVGQPDGSAIYFAVDFDASKKEIQDRIRPYFEGVRDSLAAEGGGTARYRVGAYGSGLVAQTLRDAGLIEFMWLSMSRGFRGTRDAIDAGEFHLNQLPPEATLLGLGVDFNVANPARPDFGGFTVDTEDVHGSMAPSGPGTGVLGTAMRVTARSGLRLRAGPATSFDVIGLLPFGTTVFVDEIRDGWAKVDREGDGKADGFAFAAFLE